LPGIQWPQDRPHDGRRAIFEWMDADNEIRQLILKSASTDLVRDAARRGGMRTLAEDGWRLVRYAPDGRVDRIIELPVQKPTSCMFGGTDLSTLYVTSAVWDLTGDALRNQPRAGGLFAVDVGVRGLPEPRFAR